MTCPWCREHFDVNPCEVEPDNDGRLWHVCCLRECASTYRNAVELHAARTCAVITHDLVDAVKRHRLVLSKEATDARRGR